MNFLGDTRMHKNTIRFLSESDKIVSHPPSEVKVGFSDMQVKQVSPPRAKFQQNRPPLTRFNTTTAFVPSSKHVEVPKPQSHKSLAGKQRAQSSASLFKTSGDKEKNSGNKIERRQQGQKEGSPFGTDSGTRNIFEFGTEEHLKTGLVTNSLARDSSTVVASQRERNNKDVIKSGRLSQDLSVQGTTERPKKPPSSSSSSSSPPSPVAPAISSISVFARKLSGNDVSSSRKMSGRLSFHGVSQRVARILRCRQAMLPRRGSGTNETIVEEKMLSSKEMVTDMPTTPRFSSFMSPEAQYALMKGYEDLLHAKLSSDFPEYQGLLKRNKTPHHTIAIRRKTGVQLWQKDPKDGHGEDSDEPGENDEERYDDESENSRDKEIRSPQGNRDSPDSSAASVTSGDKAISQSSSGFKKSTNPVAASPQDWRPQDAQSKWAQPKYLRTSHREANAHYALENLRRMSTSLPVAGGNLSDVITSEGKEGVTLLKKTPSFVPESPVCALAHDRRLVLSYRMESAMDILDTIKSEQRHTLSPRVKAGSKKTAASLTDFNSWATRWATEFKAKKLNSLRSNGAKSPVTQEL